MACAVSTLEVNCSSQFTGHLLNNLQDMKADDDMTDFTIKMNALTIPCHRLILAAASPYFKVLLKTPMKEANQGEVDLSFLNEEYVGKVIEYCYTGQITVYLDTVHLCLEVVEYLQLQLLKTQIDQFISDNLCPKSCIGWFFHAEKYNLELLKKQSKAMMITSFSDVAMYPEFHQLTVCELIEYVQEVVAVTHGDVVLEACLEWMSYNVESRSQDFLDVLHHLRLDKCSEDGMKRILKSCKPAWPIYDEIQQTLTSQSTFSGNYIEKSNSPSVDDQPEEASINQKKPASQSLARSGFDEITTSQLQADTEELKLDADMILLQKMLLESTMHSTKTNVQPKPNDSEIENLKAQMASLQKQMSEKKMKQKTKPKIQQKTKDEEMDNLKSQVASLQKQLSQNTNKQKAKTNDQPKQKGDEIEDLKTQVASLQRELAESGTKQKAKTKDQPKSKDDEIEKMKSQLASLQRQISQKQQTKTKGQAKSNEGETEKLKAEVAKLQKQLSQNTKKEKTKSKTQPKPKDKTIFVIGGDTENNVLNRQCWKLNLSNGKSELLGKMPHYAVKYGAAYCTTPRGVLNYVIGGSTSLKESKPTTECATCNVADFTWGSSPDILFPVEYGKAVYVNDNIYYIGPKFNSLMVFCLNLDTGVWYSFCTMLQINFEPIVGCVQDKVYVICNTIPDNELFRNNKEVSVQCLDVSTKSCSYKRPLPPQLKNTENACTVTVGDELYLVGGAGRMCAHYSPATDRWTVLKRPQKVHVETSAVHIDGTIFLCGGTDEDGEQNDIIEAYSIERNTWHVHHARLPVPLSAHMCAALHSD